MINKIVLKDVASYKNEATLETDKKVNLIYGLNGTGKSTLSNYLANLDNTKYNQCSIEGIDNNTELLVYNQKFLIDNFYESESQKGIFSLSKGNKEAETKIKNASDELIKLGNDKTKINEKLSSEEKQLRAKKEKLENKLWEVKINYAGGDRIFEYCLDGLKGKKETLSNHILTIRKQADEPTKTIEELKKELTIITGDKAQKYDELPLVNFSAQEIENEPIFQKQIVGSKNSSLTDLITQLQNSDWVKKGTEYLDLQPEKESEEKFCPFCQQKTISKEFVKNLEAYFDKSYEDDITKLQNLESKYKLAIESISYNRFEETLVFSNLKNDFDLKLNEYMRLLKLNLSKIKNKIQASGVAIEVNDSTLKLQEVNDVINNINSIIKEHNAKIDKKETVKKDIKSEFWQIIRLQYDTVIDNYVSESEKINININTIKTKFDRLTQEETTQKNIIIEQSKNTVNISEAVENIKNGLIDLGITDFQIQNYEGQKYKIVRDTDSNEDVFKSLSEGEKMIISFLYFIELCKGKKDATAIPKKKIIVIDDPISSLSHIHIFNVGRLIKNEFLGTYKKLDDGFILDLKDNYEQIFVLTHSLYFFYEITETNHDKRGIGQKLLRLVKNANGTQFVDMKYEEIQNDYQAYWAVIKDKNQNPALIANCMRNIIEYFFNFVEKKDLNNFFQDTKLKEVKYQAFYRFINRESHSLGQNIYDYKEFNYEDFKEAFEILFEVTGYKEHYKKMTK